MSCLFCDLFRAGDIPSKGQRCLTTDNIVWLAMEIRARMSVPGQFKYYNQKYQSLQDQRGVRTWKAST